jgi:hypothetical protein
MSVSLHVSLSPVRGWLDAAAAASTLRPTIRLGRRISLTIPRSTSRYARNPDVIFVLCGREYLGRVERDTFYPSAVAYEGSVYRVAAVGELVDLANGGVDRLARIGVASGQCCLCGRMLTDPESVRRGIGPVCGGRFALPGFSRPVNHAAEIEIPTETIIPRWRTAPIPPAPEAETAQGWTDSRRPAAPPVAPPPVYATQAERELAMELAGRL